MNMHDSQTQKLDPPSTKKASIKDPFKLILQLFIVYITFYFRIVYSFFKYYFLTSMKDLSGEVILITGSGRGLGRALAMEFAKCHARVALVDLDEEGNKETEKMINSTFPGKAKAYYANVANTDEVKSVSEKVMADFDHIDMLVNNAAVIAGGSFLDLKDTQYESIVNINLTGHMKMIKQFLPVMMKMNHGHVVAISSSIGLTSLTNGAAYTATNWGIIGLMDALREELRKNRSNEIQTTTICPYFINTSSDYTNAWNIRIPEMSTEYVAKSAVNAIRRNEVITTVPSFFYYPFMIWKLLPVNLRDTFRDIFYTEIVKPEMLLSKTSPITKILESSY